MMRSRHPNTRRTRAALRTARPRPARSPAARRAPSSAGARARHRAWPPWCSSPPWTLRHDRGRLLEIAFGDACVDLLERAAYTPQIGGHTRERRRPFVELLRLLVGVDRALK